MLCPKCQASIEDGRDFCTKCLTPVKRPGVLARIFSGLFNGARTGSGVQNSGRRKIGFSVRAPIALATVHRSEKIVITDPATGQSREYRSWDEVPAAERAKFEAVRQALNETSPSRASGESKNSAAPQKSISADELPQ